MADFEYEVVKHIATLSDNKGYSKEINIVSYNKRTPVIDIRTWFTDKAGDKKMTKGITLTNEEAKTMLDALSKELNA